MEFSRTPRRTKDPSMVALIDVALFLLVFFIVAGSVEKFEIIPVSLPEAESGKLIDEGHVVILLGTRDEIVMEDTLIDTDELRVRLQTLLSGNPDKVITLKADAGIPAVRMIAVMDVIKLAGGRNISLATHSDAQGGEQGGGGE